MTGHPISNNAPADDASFENPDVLTSATQGRLRTIIERIERLEEDKAKRQEEEAILDLYLSALGEI